MDEMEQSMEQPANPEQVPAEAPVEEQAAPEQAGGGSDEQGAKALLERFVYNAMKIASKDNYNEMLAMAKSATQGPQAIARPLYFIVDAVKRGLEGKGVQIPGQMYLAKNGILSQVSRVIAALLLKAGVQFAQEDVAQAIEMVATQMAADFDSKESGQEAPAEQAAPAAPAPQQTGILAQAGGMQ